MTTKPFSLILLATCASLTVHAAELTATNATLSGQPPRVHNRQVTSFTEGNREALRFDERSGDGVAWWPDIKFADGTIEFDARGKDVFQKSFVGVAFHGVDEKTYDAVYYRPFNFRATDPARRNHAVQYVALPTYDWQKLRSEHPEKYEKPAAPAPAPDQWFHARIVLAHPKVSVFVNDAAEPCLVVEQLSDRKSGWVGFWVGNGSGGEFANLKFTVPKQSLEGTKP
jgi:hypothetical protein